LQRSLNAANLPERRKTGVPENALMNLIKLGKKGQVSIPQGVLRQLGIAPDSPLLVEPPTTARSCCARGACTR